MAICDQCGKRRFLLRRINGVCPDCHRANLAEQKRRMEFAQECYAELCKIFTKLRQEEILTDYPARYRLNLRASEILESCPPEELGQVITKTLRSSGNVYSYHPVFVCVLTEAPVISVKLEVVNNLLWLRQNVPSLIDQSTG